MRESEYIAYCVPAAWLGTVCGLLGTTFRFFPPRGARAIGLTETIVFYSVFVVCFAFILIGPLLIKR